MYATMANTVAICDEQFNPNALYQITTLYSAHDLSLHSDIDI